MSQAQSVPLATLVTLDQRVKQVRRDQPVPREQLVTQEPLGKREAKEILELMERLVTLVLQDPKELQEIQETQVYYFVRSPNPYLHGGK